MQKKRCLYFLIIYFICFPSFHIFAAAEKFSSYSWLEEEEEKKRQDKRYEPFVGIRIIGKTLLQKMATFPYAIMYGAAKWLSGSDEIPRISEGKAPYFLNNQVPECWFFACYASDDLVLRQAPIYVPIEENITITQQDANLMFDNSQFRKNFFIPHKENILSIEGKRTIVFCPSQNIGYPETSYIVITKNMSCLTPTLSFQDRLNNHLVIIKSSSLNQLAFVSAAPGLPGLMYKKASSESAEIDIKSNHAKKSK